MRQGATSWRLRAGLGPEPIWGRGLSERSEFRSPNLRDRGKGTRRATTGANGFGSFCRNKRIRRAGATPRSPSVILANAGIQSCSRRIPGQSPGHASCGLERTPGKNSAMRWRRYKDRRLKTLDPLP